MQVRIQKEFKVTPHYLEIEEQDDDGYHMGVFICLGQAIHEVSPEDAIPFTHFGSFSKIADYYETNEKAFVFLSNGTHKIKRKAEQIACEKALRFFTEEEN